MPIHLFLFVDVDNLKQVNDTLGHSAGDDFIKAISNILVTSLASDTIICRIGGDEFLTYCVCEDTLDAKTVALDLIAKLNKIHQIGNQSTLMSCSIGAVVSHSQKVDISKLPEQAGNTLLLAKRNGKQQLKFFDEDECATIKLELSIASDFQNALENGAIEVFYQSIFDTKKRDIFGAEALIRWSHPGHGQTWLRWVL